MVTLRVTTLPSFFREQLAERVGCHTLVIMAAHRLSFPTAVLRNGYGNLPYDVVRMFYE